MRASLRRWWRHLSVRGTHAWFPPAAMDRIAQAIAMSEQAHTGEICFAVEAGLPWRALWHGHSARARAQEAFARLRVWDTAANNGVLMYLQLADRAIEIVADRGLDGRVAPAQWQAICARLRADLQAGAPVDAVVAAVEAIGDLLAEQFPRLPGQADANELPDRPVRL